ncbi:urease accessory protein UreD [Paraglaciecola aquimarina]|uniref:Urease accessory protein UreD n=1 Tax=Paraglaciecola aquimarina TaxID=1235557 RepID=A0ABU3SVV9_9ALTE|nr:urease accessory protein UreD [Paraglaciecola aquimarina]MDU0354151.1 urease accessory protein UreD [Paraglaciecola aquimarina]
MTITKIEKRKWLAKLALTFNYSPYGTQLARTQRVGPLTIQKAFYPEGRECAHIYLLHPPAGIVSGDILHVDLDLEPQAHVLVTTPGANRFYRARDDANIGSPIQKQITQVNLPAKAKCEHFPLETIVYNGAEGVNQVLVNLTADSHYLGWDITCLGLPSAGQLFEIGRFSQLNQVYCDNKLIYHDRINVRPDASEGHQQMHQHMAGLAGYSVFATLLAYANTEHVNSAMQADLIDQLRDTIQQQGLQSEVSVTHIAELIIIRYLGHHAEQCKQIFILLWQLLRPHYMHKQGVVPRIWHT